MVEFLVKTHDEKIWDITQLITGITYNDRLNDGSSKLEFSYLDDGDINIENGNEVRFTYNNAYIFVGRVFVQEIGKGKEVKVTAYDQLRQAKAKDFFGVDAGETVTSLVTRMCNKYNFKQGALTNIDYKLAANVYEGKTWLDIIYKAIMDTYTATGNLYYLRDDFGYVSLWDSAKLKLNLILGDGSLCYDYTAGKSIDENFYNQVILLSVKDKESNFAFVKDDESIKKYGLMQYYERADNTNISQARSAAEHILKTYNKEFETLTLECLGDTRVVAGASLYVMIDKLMGPGGAKRFIVKSVTHKYLPNHTMSVEVVNWSK